MTVKDLIAVYSADIIYIMDEPGHNLYSGSKYFCDLRLKLCAVSEFNFAKIDGYFALLIKIKEIK